MSRFQAGAIGQPFPLQRPRVTIAPSPVQPFAVDCREVPGWFGIPEVGNRTLWTIYDPPDWRLTSVTEMDATRPARVHGLECVEIEVNEWESDTGWDLRRWLMYARVTDDAVQWLAVSRLVNGVREWRTFLDEGFDTDWAGRSRHLEDRGRDVPQSDGSLGLNLSGTAGEPGAIGAGVFTVTVEPRSFTCLRVIDFSGGERPSDEALLTEAFVTLEGRTVLFRRYNGRQWGRHEGSPYAQQPPWDQRFPDHARILIDDVAFIHWYDCLSGLACGIHP